jgi:uncharacterized FAD-dependent dehydrogenase
LKAINVDHVVNEDSNYCFGEGGQERILTGNYTRDLKKGRCNSDFGVVSGLWSYSDILVEAHPHIGTKSYPKLFRIFEKIIECGGQVLFETRVMDIVVKIMKFKNRDPKRRYDFANKMILATGHSARDILNY